MKSIYIELGSHSASAIAASPFSTADGTSFVGDGFVGLDTETKFIASESLNAFVGRAGLNFTQGRGEAASARVFVTAELSLEVIAARIASFRGFDDSITADGDNQRVVRVAVAGSS